MVLEPGDRDRVVSSKLFRGPLPIPLIVEPADALRRQKLMPRLEVTGDGEHDAARARALARYYGCHAQFRLRNIKKIYHFHRQISLVSLCGEFQRSVVSFLEFDRFLTADDDFAAAIARIVRIPWASTSLNKRKSYSLFGCILDLGVPRDSVKSRHFYSPKAAH